ncbi:MAG: sulfur carrier protein ThiS adenylyltransferase ThiF [Candidatus Eisenbacteria sp.]|nr:sulfur carrier protein ThiS adenylyltransferase ThiF [Candidatus Eisenbacteria bacterium]
MRILLNERPREIPDGSTLFELRDKHKPGADVVILNGFPLEEDRILAPGDSVVFIRRGEIPGESEMEALLAARHSPGIHKKLKESAVGIAGLGGLGSAVATALARVGIGRLILADFDVVEPSNLNRQHYFIDQIGVPKVRAISETLGRINPYVSIETHEIRLDEESIPRVFAGAQVVVEAFDRAEAKAMLIETVLERMPDAFVVAASGVAGYGENEAIHTHRSGNLIICGDEKTAAAPGMGLMAPRVGVVAHLQANLVMEILLNDHSKR